MKKKDVLIIVLITAALLITMEITIRLLEEIRADSNSRFYIRADSDFRFYVHSVDNDLFLDYIVEDPILMWSLKPKYNVSDIKINSRGFRDIEYNIKKNDGVFKILCLGESSTFGWKVPLETTYHSLLEDRLNREYDGQRRFEVINAGVIGYTSVQGLYMYLSKGIRFQPDLVTFYFGINERVKRFYLSDAEIMKINRPQWLNLLVNGWLLKSELVRVVQKTAKNIMNKNSHNSELPVPRVSPAEYRKTILRLKKACDKNNARLLLISPALYIDRRRNTHEKAMKIVQYRRILENTAKEAGIPLLTIPEMTERSSDNFNYLFQKDDSVHPSKAGHRLIMQRLYNFMTKNRMLP
ncbi:MAG: SGNH/GDSL hydrolase family protein [Syntrophaceae bacterium]|nr:SGNH/GDSL hydrolase family protein [Syntrophaceae bacterium]